MDASATLEAGTGGVFMLRGSLDFGTVTDLDARARELFGEKKEITVDLSGVTRANSAGLALLMEWVHVARQQGRSFKFANIPAKLLSLAHVTELDEFLPGADAGGRSTV